MSTAVASPNTDTDAAPSKGSPAKGSPTCQDVILHYLRRKISSAKAALGCQYAAHPYVTVWSTDFELAVRHYARKRFDKLHSPSTWGRRWREVREGSTDGAGRLREIGVEHVEEIASSESGRAQSGWRLWTDEDAYANQTLFD